VKCPCQIDGGISFYVCGFNNCEGRQAKSRKLLETKKMEEKNNNKFIYENKDAIEVIMDNISYEVWGKLRV
jgi:hypothetical protein